MVTKRAKRPKRRRRAAFMPDRESPMAGFVRDRRRANRLTQRMLADLAGVGQRFVSELERGKATLRIDAINRVLAVFGKRLGIEDAPRQADDVLAPSKSS